MRGGIILLIAAIIIAYLGVSGKYACFTKALKCISGVDDCGCSDTGSSAQKAMGNVQSTLPSLSTLPRVPSLPAIPGIGGAANGTWKY